MATVADGTHRTEMHSCFYFVLFILFFILVNERFIESSIEGGVPTPGGGCLD